MDEDNHNEEEDQFQTIRETADDLHVSTGRLRQWIKDDVIKAVKPSGKKFGAVRISIQEIKDFIERHIKHEEESSNE